MQNFNFNNLQVRTVLIKNEPWFVAKDVADILGYQNGSRDVNRHVDEEDLQNYTDKSSGQGRRIKIINEVDSMLLLLVVRKRMLGNSSAGLLMKYFQPSESTVHT